MMIPKAGLLHIFNKQRKTKCTSDKQKRKRKYTQTTINQHTNKKSHKKNKATKKANKINFCSYNLISYRYIDINTVSPS